jgi:cation/acetate symporter
MDRNKKKRSQSIYYFADFWMALETWWFGISPEGIGSIGMLLNFVVTCSVSWMTKPPPIEVQQMIEEIRLPRASSDGMAAQ